MNNEGRQNGIPETQKAVGTLLGAAIGDALGWPQEYNAHRIDRKSSSRDIAASPIFQRWTRRAGGRFFSYYESILPGEYSDDTQLLLCTARSILKGELWWRTFTTCEFPAWLLYERGGGRAIKQAAASWLSGRAPWEVGPSNESQKAYFNAGSNGAAMRIAPHVVAGVREDDFAPILRSILENAICSHGHPRALLGAALYGFVLWSALRWNGTLPYGRLIDVALDSEHIWAELPTHDDRIATWLVAAEHCERDYRALWKSVTLETRDLLKVSKHAMKQGALSVDEEVLRKIGCFDKTRNGAGTVTAVASIFLASRYAADPIHGILEAAFAPNADTDTLASMTGGLLGAALGSEWLLPYADGLQDSNYIRTTSSRLASREESDKEDVAVVKKPVVDDFLTRLVAAKPGDCLVLPDKREALVSESLPLSRGSAPGPGRAWRLKTSDGQTLYVKKLSRQAQSAEVSPDRRTQQSQPFSDLDAKPENRTAFLKQVADRITFAAMNYRIWRIYTEPKDRTKYLNVLRKYNSFFLTSLQSHFLTTIITLYGLYETRTESISVGRLIQEMSDQNLRIELDPLLDEANSIWRKKITILRNDVYAHLSGAALGEKFSAANLSPNEIERLIELSKQIVNKLSYAHDRSTFAFNLDPASDTYNLLAKLARNGD